MLRMQQAAPVLRLTLCRFSASDDSRFVETDSEASVPATRTASMQQCQVKWWVGGRGAWGQKFKTHRIPSTWLTTSTERMVLVSICTFNCGLPATLVRKCANTNHIYMFGGELALSLNQNQD